MWTCPTCGRAFRNANQQHSCILLSREDVFRRRPAFLLELYSQILEEISRFGVAFREEAVPPDVIFLKTKSTFLGVKVKKDHLDIEFFLDRLEDIPPVSKFLQTSKKRFVHIVPVDSPEDMNVQLFGWIKESFDLVLNA